MLTVKLDWAQTGYMFVKPHYWSLVDFYQDDGFGNPVKVHNLWANESAMCFIMENLH